MTVRLRVDVEVRSALAPDEVEREIEDLMRAGAIAEVEVERVEVTAVPEVTWLVMAGGGSSECRRCGGVVPAPPLPLSVRSFVLYAEFAVSLHEGCREGAAIAEVERK